MESPSTAADRQSHSGDWCWLIAALVVLVSACVLEVRNDQRVALGPWLNRPLPETCAARTYFGVDCLLCGMTRSLIHLAHGRWTDSLRLHRFGWLAGLFFLSQIPYRTLRIAGIIPPLRPWWNTAGIVLGITLFAIVGVDRSLQWWLSR